MTFEELGYRLLNLKHDTYTFRRINADHEDFIYIDTIIGTAWKTYKNKKKGIDEPTPLNYYEMQASTKYIERYLIGSGERND